MIILGLKNILLLWLCALFFLWRGRADKKIVSPRRAVVLQRGKLGDMVCTTPVFCAIKRRFPSCELWVIGDEVNRELLRDNEDIDHYIVWGGFLNTLSRLRRAGIDAAFLVGPGFEALACFYLAGIPLVSAPVFKRGFSPLETKTYRLLARLARTVPHNLGCYAPREYLRVLEAVGIASDDTSKRLGFSSEAERRVTVFFDDAGLDSARDLVVGIAPSTGHKVKRWPAARFARIADYLFKQYGATILIIGGPGDKEEIGQMLEHMGRDTKAINTAPLFDLDTKKALIARLSLFVSVDTGPVYIAEAFGVPTVDIVGPVDHRDQPPVGRLHKVVYLPERKRPAMSVMNARVYDEAEAKRQTEGITPEAVISAIKELLQEPELRTKLSRYDGDFATRRPSGRGG